MMQIMQMLQMIPMNTTGYSIGIAQLKAFSYANKQEYQAIKGFTHNNDIIIKHADKDSAIVIMDKANYIRDS